MGLKVNISLAAARKRLQIAREEKDQFDEANNQILEHLKTKVLPFFLQDVWHSSR